MLEISETFLSIQGESTHAGKPCFFIRLSGCNLRCSWCDARYALPPSGEFIEIREAVRRAEASKVKLAEITGGEPLLQSDTPLLAAELMARGFTVLVETNGTLPIDILPPGVIRIVDCKPPSSGMAGANDFGNFKLMNRRDELKFPIASREDFDCMCRIIRREHPERYAGAILCSPVAPLSPAQLADWLLAEKPPEVRMQLQMHKVIWGENTRL